MSEVIEPPPLLPADPGRLATQRIAGAATLLSVGNVLSRILGLVRTQTIAHFFGTTVFADAFNYASKAPQTLYDLLVGGQLHGAIVPVLADYRRRSPQRFWRAASVLFSVLVVLSAAATLLVALGASRLAPLLVDPSRLGPEALELTAGNLRYMAVSVLLFGVAGISTGVLYVLGRYHYAALAMPVYNLAMIGGFFLFRGRLPYYALALSVSLGGLAQCVILLWGLRDSRLRPAWDLRHPALIRSVRLYAPVFAGLLVTQLQILAAGRLASMAGEGVGSVLNYADRLIQFPQGIIASSVAVAILPALALAHAEGRRVSYQRGLARGLRLVLALILPASLGMAVLAAPIVALAFQSGEFGAASAHSVSLALWAYLIGLPLAAVDLSLINAFYARQNTRGPAAVGAASVLVYLVAAAALGPPVALLGEGQDRLVVGLALADSLKHGAHVLMMVALLARAGERGALDGVSASALRALAAAALMALAVAWLDRTLAADWVASGKAGWAARCLIGVAVGAPVYLWVASRLGVEEIRWAIDLARQRLPRRS